MKNLFLLSFLFTAALWNESTFAQCTAPLSITATGNPGEVDFQFDLNGVANPADFIGQISIYNTTTQTAHGTVYITQNTNPYTYQFPENGTYDLYTTTMDSMMTCVDSAYYSYVVTGLPNTNCNASFTIVNDSTQTTTYIGYNYSTGTNLTYLWDFGDGGTSTAQFPTHTFANVGVFNVCLTIDDGNGCVDQDCQTITVYTKASQTTLNIYDPGTAGIDNLNKFTETTVYPNPCDGNFTLSFNAQEAYNTEVMILDMKGKVITSQMVESVSGINQINFNLDGIAPGVYFWRLNNDSGKLVIR